MAPPLEAVKASPPPLRSGPAGDRRDPEKGIPRAVLSELPFLDHN